MYRVRQLKQGCKFNWWGRKHIYVTVAQDRLIFGIEVIF